MKQKLFVVLLKIPLSIFARLMLYSMAEDHSPKETSFKQQGRFQSFISRSFTSQKNRLKKGLRYVLMLVLKRMIGRSSLEGTLISQGAVCKEEELNQIGRFRINPPPEDGRCEVCGRHISELKPFRDPNDPFIEIFGNELLMKKWRPEGPYNPEAQKAWKAAKKEVPEGKDPLPWFVSKYGEEKGKRLYWSGQLSGSIGPSWECRDCAGLNTNEYFEVIDKRWKENGNKQLAESRILAELTEPHKQC
jgi:hypothetical protein